MKYVLLIYGDPERYAALPKEQLDADLAGHYALGRDIGASGEQFGGAALQELGTSTTVRVRGDGEVVTDGPFAEVKEVLGGYYLVDCENLDRAIAIASRIPDARHGSVEIRPLLSMADMGIDDTEDTDGGDAATGGTATDATDVAVSADLAGSTDTPAATDAAATAATAVAATDAGSVGSYILLIHGDREWAATTPQEEQEAEFPQYLQVDADIIAAGEDGGQGFALVDDTLATTVRVRGDDTLVTDGPYAEVKEWLGGSYVVRCTLARAIEHASRIPDARHGRVEIRPLREFTAEENADAERAGAANGAGAATA